MKAFRSLLWSTVGLGVLVSVFVSYMRIQWERSYNEVALVVNYNEINDLAERSNHSLNVLLAQLKQRQVKALAFSPEELSTQAFMPEAGFELVLTLGGALPSNKFAERNPRMVILSGKEALQALPTGTIIGVLEFSEPLRLTSSNQGFVNFVRVHKIDTDELVRMTISEALARWERAVTERNIRVLHLTFFEQSLEYNLRYLDELRERLIERGFRLGSLSPTPTFYLEQEPQLFTLILVLMLTGVLSFFVLALSKLWRLNFISLLLWLLTEALLLTWVYVAFEDLSGLKKLFAFLVAIVAPISGYLFLAPYLEREPESFKRGLFGLFGFCTFSLAGGLGIGAILSSSEFFLKLDEFRGVKLALLLPLLLIFGLHFSRDGFIEFRRFLGKELQNLLLLGSVGAILLLIVLRSENFSIPVPAVELHIRGVLEELFYARPRFKEFLLGHPLLFLWGALGYAWRREYGIVVLMLGMLGQVSIINTFAHLHTPLMLSLLRTANGIVLGLVIGILLLGLFKWGERYFSRTV